MTQDSGRRAEERAGGETLAADGKIRGKPLLWVLGINLLFLGVAAYVLRLGLSADPPVHLALLVLLLPAAGLAIAWRKVGRFLAQRWKYGETTLILEHSPVPLGGTLSGHVRAETKGHGEPQDGFRVRLSCYERVERWRKSRRGHGHKEVRYHLVWRDEKQLRIGRRPDPSTVEIPVAFHLPDDAPATDHGPDEGPVKGFFRARKSQVVWRLEVLAPMPGVDFSEAIELPVVEAPAEPAPPEVEERAREAAELEVPVRRPRSDGIEVTPTPSGGIEIHFDNRRHRKRAYGAAALALGLGGGTYWLWTANAPWYALIVGGLLTLLMAWGAYDYATLSARVTVEDGEVTVERRRSTSLVPHEVRDVRAELEPRAVKIGRSLPPDAIPATYELKILRPSSGQEHRPVAGSLDAATNPSGVGTSDTRTGKARGSSGITVAQHLDDKPEADWLAAMILEAVHPDARRASSLDAPPGNRT